MLLAVRAAGICGTDLHIYHDEYPTQPPVVLGHELAGEVAAVGDGVSRVSCRRPGHDRDLLPSLRQLPLLPGRAAQPLPGAALHRLGGRTAGSRRTSWSRSATSTRCRSDLTFQEAALSEPLACVVHGALELPKVTAGDVAVVAGPGAIGLLTLQVARAAGAAVIVLGTSADRHRLELAAELGAARAIDVGDEDPAPIVQDLTGGWGADIVFECSGAGPAALASARPTRGAAGSTPRSGSSASRWPGTSIRSA